MKLSLLFAVIFLAAAGSGCRAKTQQSIKDDIHDDAEATKNGIDSTAQKAGKGIETGFKKAGEGIGIGLEKTGQGFRRAGEALTGRNRGDAGASDGGSDGG